MQASGGPGEGYEWPEAEVNDRIQVFQKDGTYVEAASSIIALSSARLSDVRHSGSGRREG